MHTAGAGLGGWDQFALTVGDAGALAASMLAKSPGDGPWPDGLGQTPWIEPSRQLNSQNRRSGGTRLVTCER